MRWRMYPEMVLSEVHRRTGKGGLLKCPVSMGDMAQSCEAVGMIGRIMARSTVSLLLLGLCCTVHVVLALPSQFCPATQEIVRSDGASSSSSYSVTFTVLYPDSRLPKSGFMQLTTDVDWVLSPEVAMEHVDTDRWERVVEYPDTMNGEVLNVTALLHRPGLGQASHIGFEAYDMLLDGDEEVCITPGFSETSVRRFSVVLDGDMEVSLHPYFCTFVGKSEMIKDVHSPQLNNTRDIYLYTPPSLVENPLPREIDIMFVNDGRMALNLLPPFADGLLINGQIPDTIFVGLPQNLNRQYELTPTKCKTCINSPHCASNCDCSYPGRSGGADEYLDFMIDTVLPLVLDHYKVIARKLYIAGWSYGGLNSCYAALTRPSVFSGAYCGSSALYWNCQELTYEILPSLNPPPHNVSFFVDLGTAEAGTKSEEVMVGPNCAFLDEMVKHGFEEGKNVWLYLADGDYHVKNSFITRFWLAAPRIMSWV